MHKGEWGGMRYIKESGGGMRSIKESGEECGA